MTADAMRVLRALNRTGEVYRLTPETQEELDDLGVEIQREHPLNEPPFFYPLNARSTARVKALVAGLKS